VPITSVIKNQYATDSVIQCSVVIGNERNYSLSFNKDAEGYPPVLIYSIEKEDRVIKSDTLKIFTKRDELKPGYQREENFRIPVKDLPKGTYRLLFGIRFGVIPEAYNSNELLITIK
jgi:hypothetical protein